jgi:hypothetical protein
MYDIRNLSTCFLTASTPGLDFFKSIDITESCKSEEIDIPIGDRLNLCYA